MNRGVVYGLAAYILWGFFPLFWKQLHAVPAGEVVAHRIVWSLGFLALLHIVNRKWVWLETAARSPRVAGIFLCSSFLLGINWGLYIWAVQANRIVDASLGYFITPLINIALGLVVLKEKLRTFQVFAVILAAVGVMYFTVQFGSLPFIALALAFSFGLYGLIRKKAPLNSLDGLSLETLTLFLPALSYLVFLQSSGKGHWAHDPLMNTMLLTLSGAVTAIPLLLFGASARRVTLASVGIMQYLSPSLQFLIGVLIYHEPFSIQRLIGFIIIWIASLLYTIDSVRFSLKTGQATIQNSTEKILNLQ